MPQPQQFRRGPGAWLGFGKPWRPRGLHCIRRKEPAPQPARSRGVELLRATGQLPSVLEPCRLGGRLSDQGACGRTASMVDSLLFGWGIGSQRRSRRGEGIAGRGDQAETGDELDRPFSRPQAVLQQPEGTGAGTAHGDGGIAPHRLAGDMTAVSRATANAWTHSDVQPVALHLLATHSPSSSSRRRGCQEIDGCLDVRCASFETDSSG